MINEKPYKPTFFENLDSFRLNFNFKIDKKENIRTKLGAIISLLYILLVASLFFGFGLDLYLRRNPRVSTNSKMEEYKETIFSNKNFTFAFRVEDQTGKIVVNDSIISLEVAYFQYAINENGVWENIFGQLHPFRRCNELNTTKEKEKIYNISLASWYCLDFENLKMGGNWNGNFVYGLLINTKQCQYSKNPKCLKEQDLKASFKNELTGSQFFYSFLYMETLPEMDNFKIPLKLHLINKYELLTLKTLKRSLQTYKKVQINNDKGWFLDDREEKIFYSSESVLSDFSLKEEFEEDVIYSHFIYFGNKIDIYNRSYSKIQEVIANIGGFSKILYVFMNYLFVFFGDYLKNIFLLKRINFDLKENNKNISNNIKPINISNWKTFKKPTSRINFHKNNDHSINYKKIFYRKNSNNNNSNENRKDEIYFNQSINFKNLNNPNYKEICKENIKTDIRNFSDNIPVNKIKSKNQNYREKISTGDLDKFSPKIINLKHNRTSIDASNDKTENNYRKLGDSSNLVFLNQEVKEENEINLNKPNEMSFNHEIHDKNPSSLNRKIFSKELETAKNSISIYKLMCGFLKPKKGTVRSNFGLHFYLYFVEYIDKTLNIFNYFQICNEFNNIKSILFEDYTKKFSNIKPMIMLNESETEIRSLTEKDNFNNNRVNSQKIDRIITNLFAKFDN